MSNERNALFDYAKGIGILLVVYGHVARGLLNAGLPMDRRLYGLIDSVIYSFHMPLFFFLSGMLFLTSMARQGTRKLIENKFKVIFYPYIVWSLIQGSLELMFAGYTNSNVTLVEILSLLWRPHAQFWFLYTLFIIYLASAILYRRSETYWSLTILAMAVIMYVSRFSPFDIYALDSFGENFVFFALGVSTSSILSRSNVIQIRPQLMFSLSVVAFVGSQYVFYGPLGLGADSNEPTGRLVLALGGIALVMALSRLLMRFECRWMLFFGRHSMEIYLIHIIAASGIRIVLQKFFGILDVSLHLALGMLFGMGIPLLVAALAAKIGLRWLFAVPARKLHFGAAS